MSHTHHDGECDTHKCVTCIHQHRSAHWMDCSYCAYACVTENGQCHWEEIPVFEPVDMTQTIDTIG